MENEEELVECDVTRRRTNFIGQESLFNVVLIIARERSMTVNTQIALNTNGSSVSPF